MVLRSAAEAAEIAYYCMEVGLDDRIPSYSGGLGVLAGDILRAAADGDLPMVGVTLLYSGGFFDQTIDSRGGQQEHSVAWRPGEILEELPQRVSVEIGGRPVLVKSWRLVLQGIGGNLVPVYFLDTNLAENLPADRAITDRLYLGDRRHRLSQEVVLGVGGALTLRVLGHDVQVHHMNEGHASFVPVALLAEQVAHRAGSSIIKWEPSASPLLGSVTEADLAAVRQRCVFTTHTPVPAGHDRFSEEVVQEVLGAPTAAAIKKLGCLEADGSLNMTLLGMCCSHFVNAVSPRHREVSSSMFPGTAIRVVANGIHSPFWAAPATASLFDRHIPDWRRDNTRLRYVSTIPLPELAQAHRRSKLELCDEVRRRSGQSLDPDMLTIGIARRATAYKRADLVLSDPERLQEMARKFGTIQLVFSGKAHPQDQPGKDTIKRIIDLAPKLAPDVMAVYLANYDMSLSRMLCAGSDVWLNTPQPPHEASGTSGMKAALNGVPSLSTMDGWWLEGNIQGVTGWGIGPIERGNTGRASDSSAAGDAEALYRALEDGVLPLYYERPEIFGSFARNAIALNAPYFSAQRMIDEYARIAYMPFLAKARDTRSRRDGGVAAVEFG